MNCPACIRDHNHALSCIVLDMISYSKNYPKQIESYTVFGGSSRMEFIIDESWKKMYYDLPPLP
jgi:hypothetical protein